MKPHVVGTTRSRARSGRPIAGGLDALESDPPLEAVNIGSITVACAAGCMGYRSASEAMRPRYRKLAARFEVFAQNRGQPAQRGMNNTKIDPWARERLQSEVMRVSGPHLP